MTTLTLEDFIELNNNIRDGYVCTHDDALKLINTVKYLMNEYQIRLNRR